MEEKRVVEEEYPRLLVEVWPTDSSKLWLVEACTLVFYTNWFRPGRMNFIDGSN